MSRLAIRMSMLKMESPLPLGGAHVNHVDFVDKRTYFSI